MEVKVSHFGAQKEKILFKEERKKKWPHRCSRPLLRCFCVPLTNKKEFSEEKIFHWDLLGSKFSFWGKNQRERGAFPFCVKKKGLFYCFFSFATWIDLEQEQKRSLWMPLVWSNKLHKIQKNRLRCERCKIHSNLKRSTIYMSYIINLPSPHHISRKSYFKNFLKQFWPKFIR